MRWYCLFLFVHLDSSSLLLIDAMVGAGQMTWDFGPSTCVATPASPVSLAAYNLAASSGSFVVGNNYGTSVALSSTAPSTTYAGVSGTCNIGLALVVRLVVGTPMCS